MDCTGCLFAILRYVRSRPALHCLRFCCPASVRCIDYRAKKP